MAERRTIGEGSEGVAVIAGVGPGIGLATARLLARNGFRVAMLARDADKLEGFAAEIRSEGGEALGIGIDLRDEAAVISALDRIEQHEGEIALALYNAGAQYRKPLLDITGDAFEKVWRLGCLGAFVFAREAVKHMLVRERGTLLFTGATASVRGGSNFAAFASAKFGARAVIQSVAREFGPQGIHAATVLIDGAVDMPAIHKMMPDLVASLPPDGLLSPTAVAENFLMIHRQPRSAWTLEMDVRPYAERF